MQAATSITNLLYTYAERFDAGDLDGAAELFRHATVRIAGGQTLDRKGLRALWAEHVRIHPNGTPMTKHVITNPIVDIDEAGETATCRSYYTVLQATPGLPLQVVGAGRYHDRFARIDGTWQFVDRDYSMLDLQGNMAEHLLIPPAPADQH